MRTSKVMKPKEPENTSLPLRRKPSQLIRSKRLLFRKKLILSILSTCPTHHRLDNSNGKILQTVGQPGLVNQSRTFRYKEVIQWSASLKFFHHRYGRTCKNHATTFSMRWEPQKESRACTRLVVMMDSTQVSIPKSRAHKVDVHSSS